MMFIIILYLFFLFKCSILFFLTQSNTSPHPHPKRLFLSQITHFVSNCHQKAVFSLSFCLIWPVLVQCYMLLFLNRQAMLKLTNDNFFLKLASVFTGVVSDGNFCPIFMMFFILSVLWSNFSSFIWIFPKKNLRLGSKFCRHSHLFDAETLQYGSTLYQLYLRTPAETSTQKTNEPAHDPSTLCAVCMFIRH